MLGRVFKAYDIRGKYPDLLTDTMAWQIGYGTSRYLLEDAAAAGETTPMMHNIVVGRDMRTSSPKLAEELRAGITTHGAHVIDLGLVDTPFVYFAVNHLDCAGGVMVTASHNPPAYNGFKICKRRAKPVGEATGLGEIRKFAAMADRTSKAEPTGRLEKRDLWDAYIQHVHAFLDLHGSEMKIVVDASNGMAGTSVPRVFGRRGKDVEGLEIVEINFENSKGQFVHEPNPLVAGNLAQVREAVVQHEASLGICFDGDADRCVVIDEKGGIVGCDHLTALLARAFLADRPGAPVIYDLRSSKAVPEEITSSGGVPVRSRVGHVFMKQRMGEEEAVFGGELSGHFYFRENYNADSGLIAMASVLSTVAREGRPISELIAPLARYAQSGEINFEIEDPEIALTELQQAFADRARIDFLDGITIDCFEREGWWANVRKSNTEPLLRLNAEARDEALLERVVEDLSPRLGVRVDH